MGEMDTNRAHKFLLESKVKAVENYFSEKCIYSQDIKIPIFHKNLVKSFSAISAYLHYDSFHFPQ